MLNINTRISLSTRSKRIIANRRRQNGGATWANVPNSVKRELSWKLLWNQMFKCAYCERYLIGLAPEMDHFAHKGVYGQFTFNPTNIYYSCRECNSPGRKGQIPTLLNNPNRYDQCDFIIVHPLLNNPEIEIRFLDPDRIYFHLANCTQIGRNTITLFRFDDYEMTNIRARQLIFERDNPFDDWELKRLILEAIAYR